MLAKGTYAFPDHTSREVRVQLAEHLGLNQDMIPDGTEEARYKRIARIELQQLEAMGRGNTLAEWDEHEIRGKAFSEEALFRKIEVAACRDAAYQMTPEVIYCLIFHAKERSARSRFRFKLPGGSDVGAVAPMAAGRDMTQPGIAERLMPDILKYVAGKEEQLEKRSAHLWDLLMKSNQNYASVIQDYTDKEAKLREILLGADEASYELDKRRKKDRDLEAAKSAAFKFFGEKGPGLLLGYARGGMQGALAALAAPALAALGTGGVASSPATNGSPSPGSPGAAPAVPASPAAPPTAATAAPSDDVGRLRTRVAIESAKFVSLVRMRGHEAPLRSAMSDPLRARYDAVAESCARADLGTDAGIVAVSDLALGFGMAAITGGEGPALAAAAPDDVTRIALFELAQGLEALVAALGAAGQAPQPAPQSAPASSPRASVPATSEATSVPSASNVIEGEIVEPAQVPAPQPEAATKSITRTEE